MIKLYHGSIFEINQLDLAYCKGYKDFGRGFYATAIPQHADRLAVRNKHAIERRNTLSGRQRTEYHAYRYNLEFNDECLHDPEKLNVKIFTKADAEWVRFVVENRGSDISAHNYDIVIGPTADAQTVTIINQYAEELIEFDYPTETLKRLLKELQPENLPEQYFFGTEKALGTLRFASVKREVIEW